MSYSISKVVGICGSRNFLLVGIGLLGFLVHLWKASNKNEEDRENRERFSLN